MRPPKSTSSGFSIIEVLVAALIFGIIALGLVPLFTRSIRSNVEGFDYTQVSNLAKSRAEQYLQFPFNSAPLEVEAGKDALEVVDYYSDAQHDWVKSVDSGDTALFKRTTTVRQFRLGEFGAPDLETPLPGGSDVSMIHLKEISVRVESARPTALGGGKDIAVRVFKSQ